MVLGLTIKQVNTTLVDPIIYLANRRTTDGKELLRDIAEPHPLYDLTSWKKCNNLGRRWICERARACIQTRQ